jgi:O-methyltransferase
VTSPIRDAQLIGADLYLNLLKRTLTGALFEESDTILGTNVRGLGLSRRVADAVGRRASALGLELVIKRRYDPELRRDGRDWPARAESMIGLRRMENLQFCVESVLKDDVPGDLIETGVWRGGATIFMRAILKAHGVRDRVVWVADSFEGLPKPDPRRFPADRDDLHHEFAGLRVGVEQVKHNFRRYELLDDQVQFLVGWFKDTLISAPIQQLSVLRLDGDMYESTMDAIQALYPKLSPGGYCIVDDYGNMPGCKQAITDYRQTLGITDPIVDIDGFGAYWRRRSTAF